MADSKKYTRIIQRHASYSDWLAIDGSVPGGLRVAKAEQIVAFADSASAAKGWSILATSPEATKPADQRLPVTGEVMGWKWGVGSGIPFSQIKWEFPFSGVKYDNGRGRVLGTQNSGANYDLDHPFKVQMALFQGPYVAPSASMAVISGQPSLIEVSSDVGILTLRVQPVIGTYRIREASIKEGAATLSVQTAGSPDSVGTFIRDILNFKITAANNPQPNGIFRRTFTGYVTDDRPSSEGGPNVSQTNSVVIEAVYPTYYGISNVVASNLSSAQIGVHAQTNLAKVIKRRGNTEQITFDTNIGQRIQFFQPQAFGLLTKIEDILGLTQLGNGGVFPASPVEGSMVIGGIVVKGWLYESNVGFGEPQKFIFKA